MKTLSKNIYILYKIIRTEEKDDSKNKYLNNIAGTMKDYIKLKGLIKPEFYAIFWRMHL